jgi:3-deoxy-D-manno-octulosonate 8-phosphate phosphatase (KDO 8-P phosphatase)
VRRGRPARARLRRIRLVVLDVDGVLTDGALYYGPDGEWKRFHVHDGLALSRAVAAGLAVAIVSARRSEAVARRCTELALPEVHQGVRDKLAVYEAVRTRHGCRDAEVAGIGDDVTDLPLLRRVGLSAAPADAVPEVRAAVDWVTAAAGGQGAVRELLEAILRARGAWEANA